MSVITVTYTMRIVPKIPSYSPSTTFKDQQMTVVVLGRWSFRYLTSSGVAPGQFVSSISFKCCIWTRQDNPLTLNCWQPATEIDSRGRMEQMVWRPKSRTCGHQRTESDLNLAIVEMNPRPMSVMWMHLKMEPKWKTRNMTGI